MNSSIMETREVKGIPTEEISKIELSDGTVCYLIQSGLDFGDGLGLYDHEGYDYLGNPTRESKKTILDSNFNIFLNQIGHNIKTVELMMAGYRAKGLDVFLGKGAPIKKTERLVLTENKFKATENAIWARPTEEQVNHYNDLLKKSKGLKKIIK